jgi:hypothetical protein
MIPAFSATELHGAAHKPDELLQDAKRLLDLLEPERSHLPSAETLMTSLTAARAAAQSEWTLGQRTLARHRELQHEVGKTFERMEQVLLAFRTTLEEVLGADHRDCQMLRTPRRKARADTEVSNKPETNDANRGTPIAAE